MRARRTATAVIVLGLGLGLAPGCGDEVCGPGDAPNAGVTLAVDGRALSFGDFTSSANNDCTPAGAEVTSLTLEGFQQGVADHQLTFCLPRPDRIGEEPIPITEVARLEVIDVVAADDGCTLTLDRDRPLAGTARFEGYCAAGGDPAGYALSFDAQLPLVRTCGDADPADVSGELSGRTAVSAQRR
jgi:hypothetical protein